MKFKIISKLEGGLGNQLFQYAIAKKICRELDCELVLDIGVALSQGKKRELSLLNLNIFCNTIVLDHTLSLYPKLALEKFGFNNINILLENKNMDVLKQTSAISNDLYLIGWWQSYKYFENIKEVLVEEIYPKTLQGNHFNEAKLWLASFENTLAIHVRRGDFINESFGILPKSYYLDSIMLASKKLKNFKIIYFSDDPHWVKNELTTIFDGEIISNLWTLEDYEELVLMSMCDHHIIANSSFSWWGCWLKKNTDGFSIRPSKWFAKNNEIVDSNNICPNSWIEVQVVEDLITLPSKLPLIRNLKYRLISFLALIKYKVSRHIFN